MKKTYLFLNTSFFFWFLTLIGWFFSYLTSALFSFALSILFLIVHFNQKKVSKMFTKRQNKPAPTATPPSVSHEPEVTVKIEEQVTLSTPTISEEKTNTIISRDVVFEGNITSNEQVHIYGKVIGNITGKDNTVKVMLNGQVTGNITCKELVVNGRIEGECHSDTISIENNGEIHGTIHYSSLSIKKGGILSGQAQVKNPAHHSEKVTVLKDKLKQDALILNESVNNASL
ncbi:polymer-forming cytoskeletal protein [Providencia rettgeri]|nr:polymer-forming cytoskeletal protein [Providencia rettgeri]ELR5074950.1 polymer-forming cytoskeletal protein [Providencia stuartii]MBV2187703.1 polymer-forming cytoskeletal protein [Providencia rettgeri]